MELTPYLDALHRDLAAAAAPAGPDVAHTAELLSGALDVAARMCLLEALSDAAAEITTKLADSTVEVRLRGREAQLVVTANQVIETAPTRPPGMAPPSEEPGDIARLTLRLPDALKDAVERAAAAESISVNAWLVRAITQVLSGGETRGGPLPRGRMGRRVTGFAQA